MGDLIGFLLVIPVLALIAVGFHYLLSNRILAIVIPTLVVPLLLPIIDYFTLGYIDPFTIIAVINVAILMLVISVLVSVFFKKHRQVKEQGL
ncbi:MAG: hypothetical protein ABJK64_08235 [Paraglaciecola sp.]|uniref:hypothetical protein n=1 Tax=Paraglaciecola sp. TaxID=1920173 RepID=UPI0032984869